MIPSRFAPPHLDAGGMGHAGHDSAAPSVDSAAERINGLEAVRLRFVDALPSGDAITYGMLRRDCRWLEE